MRSRSKSTAAATSGPARHPRPASSAPATQRTPKRRSWAKSFEPDERRRLGFFFATGTGASTARSATARSSCRSARAEATPNAANSGRLQRADALRRPVGGEGAADDPLLRDRAPEARVVGLAAVVAHHEVHALGDRDRLRERALRARRARVRVVVLLALAVADHVAVDDPDAIPGDADDSLDEVHVGLVGCRPRAGLALGVLHAALADPAAATLGALRRVEDEDVADRRVAE